jgi:methionine sulfoxide reductase heme-binding subunit
MEPDKPQQPKQRLDDGAEPAWRPAAPLAGGPAAPQAWPPAIPISEAPGATQTWPSGAPAPRIPNGPPAWSPANPNPADVGAQPPAPTGPQGGRPGPAQTWQPRPPLAAPAPNELGVRTPNPLGVRPATPLGVRPATPLGVRPATPLGVRPVAPLGGGADPRPRPPANPLSAGGAAPLGARAATLPAGSGATPLGPRAATLPAGGGATPRPPSRTGAIYRGVPLPIRVVGWIALAVVCGWVIGATAPTAIERLGAVAAIQPGLLAWYSVRALGFLAYFVLAASVLYGLLLSTKILDTIAHRPVSFALHKDLAIVALILASLHGALLVFDQSFDFTIRSILVPFASPYAPVTVGIGQLAFYASIVVTASFYVRRYIGQRAWRILHYVTFLAFIGATFHGIASGSDSGSAWAFWVYLVPATASIFLITYRIVISVSSRIERARDRKAGIGAPLGPVRGPLDRPGAAPGGF